ncbi:MAG: ABC transporter permease [Alphaproteobacteria bacterium]|nr:ABC transporter permease [Alphaproteobacteria bacterium]
MTGRFAPARWPRPLRSARVLVGGGIVLSVLLCAIFAPLIAPYDPNAQDLLNTLLPPAWMEGGNPDFLLGTDNLGQDTLSRLIYGARVAMVVAIVAALGAMLLGTTLALVAGYFGGVVDWLISRAVDLWMSFPPVVLSLILIVGFGVGLSNVILAIVLVDWTRFCRVVRSEVLVVRRYDYIDAARLAGFSHLRTLMREVLPAVAPLIITLVSLEMAIALIVEAILSFVGMSVEANIPAWGVMIADARKYMYQTVWGLVLPILAIVVTVIGFNLLGDGLRRTLDPKLLQRETVAA